MNRAIWKRAYGEVQLVLPCLVLLMFGFQILHDWVASQLNLEFIEGVLRALPDILQRVSPVSIETMASYPGRIAIGYDHPVVAFGTAFWAIARGSDAISGPLNRGTLEMVLAQPVRRVEVLISNAVVATIGSALMATACWLGTLASLISIEKLSAFPASPYAYCALNLFSYSFFLAAFTTLVSSADRYRSRTIGLAVAFYVLAILLKLGGRIAVGFQALTYFSFLTPYEPQRFVDPQYEAARLAFNYNVPLIFLGLGCYIAAGVIFARRDLPAPL